VLREHPLSTTTLPGFVRSILYVFLFLPVNNNPAVRHGKESFSLLLTKRRLCQNLVLGDYWPNKGKKARFPPFIKQLAMCKISPADCSNRQPVRNRASIIWSAGRSWAVFPTGLRGTFELFDADVG